MQGAGKILLTFGLVLVVVGVALMFFEKIPFLGKLPGDITIKRGNFQMFIPVTTSLLLSLLLSAILWIVFQIRGK